MKIKLKTLDHICYIKNRIFWRSYEYFSNVYNRKTATEIIGILGAYYSSNIGDICMGSVLNTFAKKQGIPSTCVSHLFSSKKKIFRHLICGGGELGDEKYFSTVFSLVSKPKDVSIVGISPWCKLHEASPDILNKLKKVPYFSVRSKKMKSYLSDILRREDIKYAPDVAFALPRIIEIKKTCKKINKIAGINIIPFYSNILSSGHIVPSIEAVRMFKAIAPALSDKVPTMVEKYINLISVLIEILRDRYEIIVALPFSYGDYLFSKQFFKNTGIVIRPYTRKIKNILREISTYDFFIASRLHSHIFSLLSGTPTVSIAYASKCINLLSDIGVNNVDCMITREDIVNMSHDQLAKRLLDSGTILLEKEHLSNIIKESVDSIKDMLNIIKTK